jgi:hypothetical protein
VADRTIRYRAGTRYTYAQALVDLAEYARGHQDDFTFGPLDVSALEQQGLAVSGPDLSGVRKVLAGIPGLIQE